MPRKLATLAAPCLLLAGCLMSRYEIDPSLDANGGGKGNSTGGSTGRVTAGSSSTEGGEPETGGSSGATTGGVQSNGGTKAADGTDAMGGTTSTGGTSQTGGNAQGGSAGETSGGGVAGAAGSMNGGPSVCDNNTKVLTVAKDAYIDNFETDSRFSAWYAYSDTNPPNLPMTRAASGALSTGYSGRAAAMSIKLVSNMGYGAGFSYSLIDPTQFKCVDISAFDGVSFWMKGASGANGALEFQAVIPDTLPVSLGGDCPAQSSKCYQYPTKAFTLSSGWTHFVFHWADLQNANIVWDQHRLVQIQITTRQTDYDVSIDEVTFFKGTAPSGPVSPPP